jgi:hypothetical protein
VFVADPDGVSVGEAGAAKAALVFGEIRQHND